MADDIHPAPGVVLPMAEVEVQVSTPGGPGGQHANRNQTKVELVFAVADSSLPDDIKRKLIASLGEVVRVTASDTRSQSRNRDLARSRLEETLREALRPKKRRRPTKPSRGARRRRLESKRKRSEKKRLRRSPRQDGW